MLDRATVAMDCDEDAGFDPRRSYAETVALVERLHHRCLDVIRDEFRRLGIAGITSTQALLVFRIGPRELTASGVMQRGCYQGSSVSYNLRMLNEGGFLHQRRNMADGRSVLISLTERGREIRDVVASLFKRHAEEVESSGRLDHRDVEAPVSGLQSLERFWIAQCLHEWS